MQNINLTNHFLIAMPNMENPYFVKALTYICEHNQEGALGVIINRPIDLSLQSLLEQIGIDLVKPELAELPIYYGGPVQMDRGFVLHQPLGAWQSTLAMNAELGLTTSKDILQAVGDGAGPERLLITLGYAGWEPGQLEQELAQNAWLSVEADPDVIFELPAEERLVAAMSMLGVDYLSLSEEAGHA